MSCLKRWAKVFIVEAGICGLISPRLAFRLLNGLGLRHV